MRKFSKTRPETSSEDFQTLTVSTKPSDESERLFRFSGERIMHQVWSAFPDGRLDYVNGQTVDYFGRTHEQLVGEGWRDAVHPEDLQTCIDRWTQAVETGDYYEAEFRLRRADGVYRWHLARANSERAADGTVLKWFGTNTDVHDQRRAEDALRRSEEQFRSIVETTSEWIWAVDADGIATYCNPAVERILGFRPEEILGGTLYPFMHEDEHRRIRRRVSTFVEERRGWSNLVCRWRHKDGSVRHLESNAVPIFDADGNLTGFRGADRDVTERIRAEQAVEENLSLLISTFEATADGILVVDLDNRIVKYNRQFVEMWRIPDEIIRSRDNKKTVEYVMSQLANAAEFAATTERLINEPEIRNFDLLEFKDGKVYERYSQPQMLDGKVVGRVLSFRDITERRQAEQALHESRKRYQQLFESNPHPVWVYDLETLQFLAVNGEAVKHYGYAREEFLRMTIKDIRPPEDVKILLEYVREAAAAKCELAHTVRHKKKDGTVIDVEIASQPVDFGGRAARLALATDVTERIRTDAALRDSESKFRMLVESTSEGLLQVDMDDCIKFVNRRLCEMVGYEFEELIDTDWTRILLDDGGRDFITQVNKRRRQGISDRYEIQLKKKNGEALWVIIGGAPITDRDGVMTGSLGVFTDITERKRAEEQLLHDAFHDGLTGLANRSLFMDHLRLTIERGKSRHSNLYAILFLDLDRFKVINDSLGHAEGDRLLKLIARRLETCTRTGDLVARLGGDEFVILLSELIEENDAQRVAERVQESLKTSFDLSGHEVFTSASIGIALSSAKHTSAEDMVRDADIAMYRAKSKGKARHQVFDFEMHKDAMSQLQFETEMRYALQRGEFCIFYQPIYSIDAVKLVGFEALLRWRHPTRGLISPAEFIPLAEENGMIIRLGRWTVYESCRQMREWQKKDRRAADLTIAVNLSCKEFLQADLAEQVNASLVSTGLSPHSLKLEITESYIMENQTMAVTIMERLRALGIELSLDDFGTGYSSLSYLHRLPVSYLKIDKSFINGITNSRENAEIVYTIVKLAQNLKMKVVAEGIESDQQLAHLRQINCEYGQGYFFSKPLGADKAEALIKEEHRIIAHLPAAPVIDLDLSA